MSKPGRPTATLLLAAGALLGAVLAAGGLVEWDDGGQGGDRVASVNGIGIGKDDYLGYLNLIARDKRNPMTAADRRHVLDRVIEEKLLIERGLALDLPHSDPTVRKTIVNAMIEIIVTDVSSAEPGEAELEAFYAENATYFARPARITLRRMVFRGDGAEQRARQASAALADSDWDSVEALLADRDILALPRSPLPVAKLRGYLGPSLTDAALALAPGSYSTPLKEQAGYSLLWLQDLQKAEPQPLAEIREQVAREYQRRAADGALRDYLDRLRRNAEVTVDERFLDSLSEMDAAP